MQVMEIALVLLLVGLALFQVLLALGAPLGEAAWGGKHKNVLPAKLRISSAFSALLVLFMLSVVLSSAGVVAIYPDVFETIVLWIMTVYFAIGIVMNAVSKSKIERLWSPYSAVLCILCFLVVY